MVSGRGDDLLTAESDEEKELFPRWKGLLRSGTNAERKDRKDMFYPVLIDTKRCAVTGAGDPLPFDQVPAIGKKIKGYDAAWPIRTDMSLGNWGVGPKTLRHLISKGYVALGQFDEKRKTWGVSYLSKKLQAQIAAGVIEVVAYDQVRNVVNVRYSDIASRQIKAVWHRTTHDAGAYGSDVLRTVLSKGRLFSFPKSIYAVRDCLAAVTRDRPRAIILDFFAGSGTTLNASTILNREDGGTRRCILVTNNEVAEATYVVDRPRRIPESSRVIKLARLLTRHSVVQGLQEQTRRFVIDRLLEQRDRLKKDAEWAALVEGRAKVPVKEFTIEYGEWKVGAEPESYLIPATDENIYALFERCGSVLGEGLH